MFMIHINKKIYLYEKYIHLKEISLFEFGPESISDNISLMDVQNTNISLLTFQIALNITLRNKVLFSINESK